MASAFPFLMLLGLVPFLLMPALLAFASKHDARWTILALDVVLCLGPVFLAAAGLVAGAVPGLLVWLGLFVWAIRGTDGKPRDDGAPGPG